LNQRGSRKIRTFPPKLQKRLANVAPLILRLIFKESIIKVFIYDGSSFIDQFPAISCSSKRLIETAGIPFISRDSYPSVEKDC
jgi:hypothetical protein